MWRGPTICGAVLVGGASSRMGRPKDLLWSGSRTFLEQAIDALRPFCDELHVIGRHQSDDALRGLRCAHRHQIGWLPDAPGADGPLGGILAALDARPDAMWIVLTCDMPGVSQDVLAWLLDHHVVDMPATVGRIINRREVEPFPMILSPKAGLRWRQAIDDGNHSLRVVLRVIGAGVVPIPLRWVDAWRNVNTPADYDEVRAVTLPRDGRLSSATPCL